MFYVILAVLLVVIDQAVKFAVRANIGLDQSITLIPHILDLTHVQNTGAAFSILRQHTWLLTLTSVVVVVVMCWLVVRGFFQNTLGRWAAALVLAGGMGNLIDRVLFGAVTDMFGTTFMNFPVFNVADCCITIGVILLFLYVLLYVGKENSADRADGRKSSGSADKKSYTRSAVKEIYADDLIKESYVDSADVEDSAGSGGKEKPAGLWIAIGAAGAAVLSLCVWGIVRAKKKKGEKETQRGKRAKKRRIGR